MEIPNIASQKSGLLDVLGMIRKLAVPPQAVVTILQCTVRLLQLELMEDYRALANEAMIDACANIDINSISLEDALAVKSALATGDRLRGELAPLEANRVLQVCGPAFVPLFD